MSDTLTMPATQNQIIGRLRVLRRAEVIAMLPTKPSISTFRRWLRDGKFPGPVPGYPGQPVWRASDIEQFIGSMGQ
jgi:predicted DNA-binding transcriptional regulator AlpA